MDYREYHFTRREFLKNTALFLALDGTVSYLFYRSFLIFVLFLPGVVPFLKERKKACAKARQQKLLSQFLDGMQAVETALRAGYSVETAFAQALKELQNQYGGTDADILWEFRYIAVQLNMNRNLEELLNGLAVRSGVEDIRTFADIFAASKRTGGNLIAIIRNTVTCAAQKEETRREIQTCLAAKRLEQNIMSLVPCLILLYVQAVSPGFLDVMYHNAAGILVMSLCLALYAAAWAWGKKIVSIEV
ncbi:MAG: hypothetical protein Q4C50_01985 [Eubacteriales bacterium]|nr:hypothetical protein [Eubacteriales bacterium]